MPRRFLKNSGLVVLGGRKQDAERVILSLRNCDARDKAVEKPWQGSIKKSQTAVHRNGVVPQTMPRRARKGGRFP